MVEEYKPLKHPEVWKPYQPNPAYELSDQGRVRRWGKRLQRYTMVHPIVLKDKDGWNRTVTVAIKQNNQKTGLARAIWETFKGPVPEGYVVKFKNGCNTMCDLYNLKLVTKEDQVIGLRRGVNQTRAKKVKDLDTGKVYKSIHAAERAMCVSNGTIWAIVNGKSNSKRLGLRFEYYEEAK